MSNNDTIIYVNVDSDYRAMQETLDIYGSDDLLSDNSLRFFIGRAVGYVSEKHLSVNILNRVTEKVRESIRSYYRDPKEHDMIETKIINAWINLANSIEAVLEHQLYTNGKRNNKVLVLRSFETETIGVICLERDPEFEQGAFNESKRYN